MGGSSSAAGRPSAATATLRLAVERQRSLAASGASQEKIDASHESSESHGDPAPAAPASPAALAAPASPAPASTEAVVAAALAAAPAPTVEAASAVAAASAAPAEAKPSTGKPRNPKEPAKPSTYQLSRWEKKYGVLFEAVLCAGKDGVPPIRLVDAHWLVALSRGAHGGPARLAHRRELPESAFVSLEELKASGCPSGLLPVVCVSYPWLHPAHPDPHGAHLAQAWNMIARYLAWSQNSLLYF